MKKKLIAFVVIVFAAVVLVTVVLPELSKKDKNFSIVYLQSGEIYVGRLSRFPRLKIEDTHFLSTVKDAKDATKQNFQLIPLKESVWAPKELYLDLSHILFYGPLDENSSAAKALKEAGR